MRTSTSVGPDRLGHRPLDELERLVILAHERGFHRVQKAISLGGHDDLEQQRLVAARQAGQHLVERLQQLAVLG